MFRRTSNVPLLLQYEEIITAAEELYIIAKTNKSTGQQIPMAQLQSCSVLLYFFTTVLIFTYTTEFLCHRCSLIFASSAPT